MRELITGHYPGEDVHRDGNWWCIDTGAGIAGLARLSRPILYNFITTRGLKAGP